VYDSPEISEVLVVVAVGQVSLLLAAMAVTEY
jgi:hypothetical protein